MKRMAGLAGASGADNATGTAMKASGPSDSYGGRIRGRIKPNITFDPSSVVGNPAAEVEVRCAPDGTIVSSKLVKSSGSPAWDNAVLKAITKTEILPRDTDGRVHSPLLLVFKPND
jgi:colicin import membrane protein